MQVDDQSEKTTNIDEKKSWYLILASHVMWINRVPVCVVYPYSIMQYKTVRFSTHSEAFDPDDPTLIDRHPEYDTDKYLGDRLPTPTQQRDERYKLKASRKKSNLSAIPD